MLNIEVYYVINNWGGGGDEMMKSFLFIKTFL